VFDAAKIKNRKKNFIRCWKTVIDRVIDRVIDKVFNNFSQIKNRGGGSQIFLKSVY
jgi:hypothetical protein